MFMMKYERRKEEPYEILNLMYGGQVSNVRGIIKCNPFFIFDDENELNMGHEV